MSMLFLGILAALGLGGVAIAIARGQAPPMPASNQGTNTGGSAAPAPPADQPMEFYWTKATIALQGAGDPYNGDITKMANALQRSRVNSSVLGQVVNTGMQAIAGLVPGAGLIVWAFNFLGDSGLIDSHGGFDDLALPTKQLAQLYGLGPFETNRAGFYSNTWEEIAPKVRPPRRGPGDALGSTSKEYPDLFKKWVRYVLVMNRKRAEWHRVVRAWPADEVCLPPLIILGLMGRNMWPPPLEPFPLDPLDATWASTYSQNNTMKVFPSSYATVEYKQIVQSGDSPEQQAEDRRLATEVYEEIKSQYTKDAALFSQISTSVKWWNWSEPGSIGQQLLDLAERSGCVPALGTPANPRPAPNRRGARV